MHFGRSVLHFFGRVKFTGGQESSCYLLYRIHFFPNPPPVMALTANMELPERNKVHNTPDSCANCSFPNSFTINNPVRPFLYLCPPVKLALYCIIASFLTINWFNTD